MTEFPFLSAFLREIEGLLALPQVQQMRSFPQHGTTNCLYHCLYVAYLCYRISRRLHLHAHQMARAALLHDLFLYDWHDPSHPRWHGLHHPRYALENAQRLVPLTAREKNTILRHMWPLTPVPPRYAEGLILVLIDKYCTLLETFRFAKKYERLAAACRLPGPAGSPEIISPGK